MDNLPTLVNYHIPRTGGRSRTQFLSAVVGDQGVFNTMGQQKRDFDEYRRLPVEEKRNIRLIAGHMTLQCLKDVLQPMFGITFVRNPLLRTISHYNGFKSWTGHPINFWINKNNITLREFCLAGVREDILDNVMVRYFLDRQPGFMQIGEAHLAEALKNMHTYIHFVGLMEFTEESLRLLCGVLGVRDMPDIPRVGALNQERKLSGLDHKDREALFLVNKYDMLLYEHAVAQFQKFREAKAAG